MDQHVYVGFASISKEGGWGRLVVDEKFISIGLQAIVPSTGMQDADTNAYAPSPRNSGQSREHFSPAILGL
jgi:hypothetical protein